jgi:MSHA pilin protein MshC
MRAIGDTAAANPRERRNLYGRLITNRRLHNLQIQPADAQTMVAWANRIAQLAPADPAVLTERALTFAGLRQRPMKANGFSFLELIVTIAVAGILAAIAIPYFAQSDVEATWFYEQVKGAARYAQRQAVAQRRTVFVVVGSTNVDVCYDGGCAAHVQQAATGSAYSFASPNGVTLIPTSFSFNALGQPNPLAGLSFVVAGKTIVVTQETGYVP